MAYFSEPDFLQGIYHDPVDQVLTRVAHFVQDISDATLDYLGLPSNADVRAWKALFHRRSDASAEVKARFDALCDPYLAH